MMDGLQQKWKWAALLLLTGLLTSCLGPKPWYSKEYDRHQTEQSSPAATDSSVAYTLWMIGDCGNSPADRPWPVFELLKKDVASSPRNSCVIYLGDNIYEYGLTPDSAPDHAEMARRMTAQLDPTLGIAGRVVVIPGNHDWAQGKPEGLDHVQREEILVEDYLSRGNTFLPDHGCPGPYELPLGDSLVLLAFDSQWWLHKHAKPGKAEGCSATTDAEFLAGFDAALARHAGKQIVVAAHHPMHSYGAHGGHYHPLYHLFPLLMFNKKLWIPLPVLGSVAVWARKFHGNIQDIPHPRYRAMRDALEARFAQYPGLIYISGHDHNLQYLPQDGRHYIVSGTGSKGNYVGHGKQALFTDAETGFGKLLFLQDGSRLLEFYAIDQKGQARRVFSQDW